MPGVANTIISICVTAINSFLDNNLGIEQADNEINNKIGRASEALKIASDPFKGKYVDAGARIAVKAFDSFFDAMNEMEALEKRYNELMPQLSNLEKLKEELLTEQFRCLKEFTKSKEMIASISEGKDALLKLRIQSDE